MANAQEDPNSAMEELKQLIGEVNVSHDSETSGTFTYSQICQALGDKNTAEAWLRWAETSNMIRRLGKIKCEHCRYEMRWYLEQTPLPVTCMICGRSVSRPFGPTGLAFHYSLAEPLRRSIDDDSIYHSLIMRWIVAIYQAGNGELVGAHPGVNFYDNGKLIGEADIVLLFSDGRVVPVEVKRSGRQLIQGEVDKLRVIANLFDSPSIILGSGEASDKCSEALQYDKGDGRCRVITSEYWMNPQPSPALGWKHIPDWSQISGGQNPSLEDHEERYSRMLVEFDKRGLGQFDPVRQILD
ncbi:hypothetical protein GCM10023405_13510 [Streptomonospora salina]